MGTNRRAVWLGALVVASAGCVSASSDTWRGRDELTQRVGSPPAGGAPRADDEAALAHEVKSGLVVRLTIARNPDLEAARQRLAAALEHVDVAARLPDLELKAEAWGVPLARPYRLDQAQTLMVGVRQAFPAAGTRDAEARMALEEAYGVHADLGMTTLDLAVRAERAFAEYYAADGELAVHLEHVKLAEHFVDLVSASYQAGRATQVDVLRARVETTRLHEDVLGILQHRASAAALLNALMDRPVDAPLGPPAEPQAADLDAEGHTAGAAVRARPEVEAVEHARRRAAARLDREERSARWPSFMVGIDYWYMPLLAEPHAYGAMVSMNLPWLNGRHTGEIHAAEHDVAARRSAARAMANTIAYEVRDASVRLDSARKAFALIDGELLVESKQSYEASAAAFATGSGGAPVVIDAERAYLDVRIQRVRALAGLAMAAADLRRATGATP